MTVAGILSEKGRDVVTLSPDVSLAEATGELARKRIGALVLVDASGGIAGILSERDVVRVIASQGPDGLRARVSDVMTAKVATCTPSTTIEEVMEMMTHGRFRHMPVIDGGRLAGIVSIGDVVKRRIQAAEREAEDMRSYISAAG